MFIGYDSAAGIWISGPISEPPYSIIITEFFSSSESLYAIAQPADPAPIITKSAFINTFPNKVNQHFPFEHKQFLAD